jgi:ABC-2 type transport system ATP-binding protein
MLESSMLYNRITGYDNLKFFCKIYNVPNYKENIISIAEEFGLEKWLNQYVEHFSSGMKMKLALCRTLLLNRPILFLDEPTLGLDVKSVSFIINKLRKINKTILLTSHDMNVVEKLCDRIAFINNGNILKVGTKRDIKNLLKKEVNIEISISDDKPLLHSELNQLNFVNDVRETKQGLIISLSSRDNYKEFLSILSKYNIFMVKELESSLEDLFLKLI